MIEGNLTPIAQYAAMAKQFANEMSSPQTLARAANLMTRSAEAAFGLYADQEAKSNPLRLHHVYEWGMTGSPRGRLWKFNDPAGRGNFRTISYDFRASRKTVPVGPEVSGVANDERRQIHIFYWKAPVLEEGSTVWILPKGENGVLAFPMGDTMGFSRSGMMANPGQAGGTVGQFNDLWATYFREIGETIAAEDLVNTYQESVSHGIPKIITGFDKSGAKKLKIGIDLGKVKKTQAHTSELLRQTESRWQRAAQNRRMLIDEQDGDL